MRRPEDRAVPRGRQGGPLLSAGAPDTLPAAEEVVLGLGSCVDYEIAWDAGTLARLAAGYEVTIDEIGTDVAIGDERDLVRSVLGFVAAGAGGERFVASSDVVEAFAARFGRTVSLGGSNVRAAVALSRMGRPSTVHLVSIDDDVRRLLPTDVRRICSARHDSTDPHLIVQFPAGARVRVGDADVVAPRANRLIYVNDEPNTLMELSPDLGDALARARVALVSGFNAMRDESLLRSRLDDLRRHLLRLPAGALLVFEDAGYHVPALAGVVRSALADRVDVHGMNEDELAGLVGRPVDLLDAADVTAAVEDLRAVVTARTVVVHTAHWALAHGEDLDRVGPALDGGIALASARYLHGDGASPADLAAVTRLPRQPAAVEVARRIELLRPGGVRCVPAFDLRTDRPTTVGLGDWFVGGLIGALAAGRPGRQATEGIPRP